MEKVLSAPLWREVEPAVTAAPIQLDGQQRTQHSWAQLVGMATATFERGKRFTSSIYRIRLKVEIASI